MHSENLKFNPRNEKHRFIVTALLKSTSDEINVDESKPCEFTYKSSPISTPPVGYRNVNLTLEAGPALKFMGPMTTFLLVEPLDSMSKLY